MHDSTLLISIQFQSTWWIPSVGKTLKKILGHFVYIISKLNDPPSYKISICFIKHSNLVLADLNFQLSLESKFATITLLAKFCITI